MEAPQHTFGGSLLSRFIDYEAAESSGDPGGGWHDPGLGGEGLVPQSLPDGGLHLVPEPAAAEPPAATPTEAETAPPQAVEPAAAEPGLLTREDLSAAVAESWRSLLTEAQQEQQQLEEAQRVEQQRTELLGAPDVQWDPFNPESVRAHMIPAVLQTLIPALQPLVNEVNSLRAQLAGYAPTLEEAAQDRGKAWTNEQLDALEVDANGKPLEGDRRMTEDMRTLAVNYASWLVNADDPWDAEDAIAEAHKYVRGIEKQIATQAMAAYGVQVGNANNAVREPAAGAAAGEAVAEQRVPQGRAKYEVQLASSRARMGLAPEGLSTATG